MTIGDAVPESWALDLAMPLMFIGLAVPMLTTRHKTVAAVVAGSVAALVSSPGIAMLVAIGAGMVAGTLSERVAR